MMYVIFKISEAFNKYNLPPAFISSLSSVSSIKHLTYGPSSSSSTFGPVTTSKEEKKNIPAPNLLCHAFSFQRFG